MSEDGYVNVDARDLEPHPSKPGAFVAPESGVYRLPVNIPQLSEQDVKLFNFRPFQGRIFAPEHVSVIPVTQETRDMLTAIADGRPADEVVAELVQERYQELSK